MKLACEKTHTQEDPTSHIMVLIGEAKNPRGNETTNNVVYNCEVVIVPIGKTRSSPCNLLMANIPPTTRAMTNINKALVTKAYMERSKTMHT